MTKVNWDRVERALERDDHRMVWRPYGLPEVGDMERSAFFDAPISPPWEMPEKIFVSVAITGALITSRNNPAQPVRQADIIEQALVCAGAGASAIHLHVRDDAGYNTLSYERFADAAGAVRAKFPSVAIDGCLVAALPGEWEEMRRVLADGILDGAPINTTATHLGDALFAKPLPYVLKKTQLILESGAKPIIACYTDADIGNADRMLFRSGLLQAGQNWLILPALPGCSPMQTPRQMMEGLLRIVTAIKDVDADAVIAVCSAGRASTFVATAALLLGLNIRVGMEDTVWRWPHREDKLPSNLAALQGALAICEALGLEVADHDDYRRIVGIKPRSPAVASHGALSSVSDRATR
jgi:3-keto-5-aminohexanoate cleavage enzyme